MTPLSTLTTPLTKTEVQASIYAAIEAQGTNVTSWKPGAVARTIIAGVSIVIAALSSLIANIAGQGFLELSSGRWLTLVAYYVYGVERIEATFASGEITLTNSGGGVYSGAAGDLIFSNSITGKTYRNTEAYSLGALGTTTIGIAANEAGSDSTSGAGQIDTLVTVLTEVTASNAAAIVGYDEENDASLVRRCRNSVAAASPNGPADAYSYFSRSAVREDGTTIGVTRVRTVADSTGGVTVYVATASGAVPGTEGDPATDLGAIASSIWDNVEPQCITATIASASNSTIAVSYRVFCYSNIGLTDLELRDQVETALADFFALQPIGGNQVNGSSTGSLYPEQIEAVIRSVRPNEIYHVTLDSPSGTVTFTTSQVPVLGTVVALEIHREPEVQ